MRRVSVLVLILAFTACQKTHIRQEETKDDKTIYVQPAALEKPLTVHFINVGAGLCTLLECPDGDGLMLYDCGSNEDMSDSDLSEAEYQKLVAEAKEYVARVAGKYSNRFKAVIISHGHADHIDLIDDVLALDGIAVENVILGGPSEDYDNDTAFWTWYNGLDNGPTPEYYDEFNEHDEASRPNPHIQCKDTSFWVLTSALGVDSSEPCYSSKHGASDENMNSLVLLSRHKNGSSVILMGDAEEPSEECILKNYDASFLDVSALSAGHHGSYRGTSEEWIEGTKPEIVVFSAGTMYGHPACDAFSRSANYTDMSTGHQMTCGCKYNEPDCCKRFKKNGTDCTCRRFQKKIYNTWNNGNVRLEFRNSRIVVATDRRAIVPIESWTLQLKEREGSQQRVEISESSAARTKAKCCKICKKGCPCGDSCISCKKRCTRPPGCACKG